MLESIIVEADVSGQGLGTVLAHEQNGDTR